ncbi:hypothetical protein psal_cds_616 [Pandoravirus salinus]|uniref:Uncharacterized protein n=1 Tax=Pandoravirus salinus TaxID=1349410 RepID=S4W245_9VIRU|nr:hypothetical protein psal_cds_616 [Pandoravirus salinus]AGO84497.1 hypothetical protein psal_cds_616 [Pandoravirus salinus]
MNRVPGKDADQAPPSDTAPAYEDRLPTELQCAIMQHLVDDDPRSALSLATTSRHQAAVLESLLPGLARDYQSLVTADGASPTAIGYLRARVALGGNDARAAVLLRLTEGFVRFLFTATQWSRWRGIGASHRAVRDPRGIGPDVFPVDDVISDPSLGDTRHRAQAWYRWLTVRRTAPDRTVDAPCLVDAAFLRRTNGKSDGRARMRPHGLARHLHGIELGAGSNFVVPDTAQAVTWFEPGADAATSFDALIDLLGLKDERYGGEWALRRMRRFGAMDDDARGLLGSTASRDALSACVDRAVRRHGKGDGDGPLWSGPLRLPDFTTAFRPRFYLVPSTVGVTLAIDIASPDTETLLGIHNNP